jgi:hypothetical protein
MLSPEMKLKLLIENRPWEGEPNNEQWVDERTGLPCRIRRHPEHLHLCGYVGVNKDHSFFGLTDEDFTGVHVHGGLTYAGTEDDGIHWFGFDCAHAGDLSPGILIHLLESRISGYVDYLRDEEYRTWDYVKAEVERMAMGIDIAADALANVETLAAAKEAVRSGASVTDELAKRGYVRGDKGLTKC